MVMDGKATGSTDQKGSLWGGRFSSKTDELMAKFNASIGIDNIMWRQDIQGSIEYSNALLDVGLLTRDEQASISEGLEAIDEEWDRGTFVIKSSDEDIHTANERRLRELIGPTAGKLHTGRSRNDQVVTDLRLWLKDRLEDAAKDVISLIQILIEKADYDKDVLLPGYTHLQRAQAIRWPHFLLSHAWSLCSDLQKLKFVYWSTDVCPLGSGALAGNPFKINREQLSQNLKFARTSQNSLQAVADRDFVGKTKLGSKITATSCKLLPGVDIDTLANIAECLFWCSLTSCHLSRLAEDLIIYSTSEFGFVKLSDAYSTGSSLMPQKKNPDSLELIRGKFGKMLGNLTGFLAVLKGQPTSYNKDLQEDKETLFDSFNTITAMLKIAAGTVATLTVNKEKCRNALTDDMLATDLAYFLVQKGMPFREAHEKVGQVVRLSENLGRSLSQVPLEEMQKISPLFSEEIWNIFSFERSVEQYTTTGGTSSSNVVSQIDKLRKELNAFELKSSAQLSGAV